MNDTLPYNDLNSWLRRRFGERVQKITVDASLTCPNRDGTLGVGGCIYCNERGSGTGKFPRLGIAAQIREAKEALSRRYNARKFIAYFQSYSNTYAPVETLERLYSEALAEEDMVGLTVGTRPDCVSDEVLDLLARLNERVWVSVEYGLQSSNDATLRAINRGHDFACFADAVRRTHLRGLDVTVHLILGLPGETRDDMIQSARDVASLGIQGVKLHLLYVVRGTRLHEMYERGEYRCMTRGEYTDAVCEVLGHLPPDMVIHRLTGDPHRDELVAPLWALEKSRNLGAIRDRLAERGIRQGIFSQHAC